MAWYDNVSQARLTDIYAAAYGIPRAQAANLATRVKSGRQHSLPPASLQRMLVDNNRSTAARSSVLDRARSETAALA